MIKKIIQHNIICIMLTVLSISSFLLLLSVSWFKWGGFIIDGNVFWAPEQILEGRFLFKDFLWTTSGFFPSYIVALFYKMFGVSIESFVLCSLVIVFSMLIVLYKISRFFFCKSVSLLVVLTFINVFAFNCGSSKHSIYNFIVPYHYNSTFFILFISCALFYFGKFVLMERKRDLILWNVFMVLSFCSRLVLSVLPWIVFVGVAELFILRKNFNSSWKGRMFFVAPIILSGLIYLALLMTTGGLLDFKEWVVLMTRFSMTSNFAKNLSGASDIVSNTKLAIISFVLNMFSVFMIGVCVKKIETCFKEKKRAFFWFLVSFVGIGFVCVLTQNRFFMDIQYRCVPLLLFIGITVSICKIKSHKHFEKDVLMLTVFLVALSFVLRIFFVASPVNYGFYLLILGMLCYYLFFFKILRDFFRNQSIASGKALKICLIIFFVLSMFPYVRRSIRSYSAKSIRVQTMRGPIYFEHYEKATKIKSLLKYINENVSEDETLVVLPEGISLNYYSLRNNPMKYFMYLPVDFKFATEDKVIEDLKKYNIDYIVLIPRRGDEYGYTHFGVDYGVRIYSWVQTHYNKVKVFGTSDMSADTFNATVYERVLQN